MSKNIATSGFYLPLPNSSHEKKAYWFQFDYTDASGTYTLGLPAGTFVEDVVTQVQPSADFDATSVSLKIGDGDDDDGYMTNAQIALTTAATATAPVFKHSAAQSNPYQRGKLYAADDTLDFTWVVGTGGTKGRLVGYVKYSVPGLVDRIPSS